MCYFNPFPYTDAFRRLCKQTTFVTLFKLYFIMIDFHLPYVNQMFPKSSVADVSELEKG